MQTRSAYRTLNEAEGIIVRPSNVPEDHKDEPQTVHNAKKRTIIF